MESLFLPTNRTHLKQRGWDACDIVIISGDAYVDHPSFGSALIGRYLEKHGFKVGIIAQPDWKNPDDFLKLGLPKLCFAVSSGNMDSMVANRTSAKKRRHNDAYSPGGKTGLRPDRALLVYCNVLRQISKDIPIIIGGLEASLRRIAHYDYWSDSVRRSILFDTRADILVYGMGERPTLEIARRIKKGSSDLHSIPGTAYISQDCPDEAVVIPSYESVSTDKKAFSQAHMMAVKYFLERPSYPMAQQHQNRWMVHNPPGSVLSTSEMDNIYDTHFERACHPMYNSHGGVPAFESVKWSITSHRGCFGGCSFCALFFHQGHIIQRRSKSSILKEVRILAANPAFKGYISDIGGPTANMYGLACSFHEKGTHCGKRDCLGYSNRPCPNLKLDHGMYLSMLKEAAKVSRIKKIFISSGIRFDLFPDNQEQSLLQTICNHHISGQMKVAPEHVSEQVLRYINKPPVERYTSFLEHFKQANKRLGKKQFVIPYFITSHPGCTEKDMLELALFLQKQGFIPDQIQDFLPTPMTTSTCMYYTEHDPRTGEKIYVAKSEKERSIQRRILHFHKKENRQLFNKLLAKYFPYR